MVVGAVHLPRAGRPGGVAHAEAKQGWVGSLRVPGGERARGRVSESTKQQRHPGGGGQRGRARTMRRAISVPLPTPEGPHTTSGGGELAAIAAFGLAGAHGSGAAGELHHPHSGAVRRDLRQRGRTRRVCVRGTPLAPHRHRVLAHCAVSLHSAILSALRRTGCLAARGVQSTRRGCAGWHVARLPSTHGPRGGRPPTHDPGLQDCCLCVSVVYRRVITLSLRVDPSSPGGGAGEAQGTGPSNGTPHHHSLPTASRVAVLLSRSWGTAGCRRGP